MNMQIEEALHAARKKAIAALAGKVDDETLIQVLEALRELADAANLRGLKGWR